MQIGPTPIESLQRLGKMRELFRRMRDERVNHPSVSEDTKRHVATYYGAMMEALDEGMRSITKAHKLKIEPLEAANDHPY
jgi:hypothetical protein